MRAFYNYINFKYREKNDKTRVSHEPYVPSVHHHNATANMGPRRHPSESDNKSAKHQENVRWLRIVKEPADRPHQLYGIPTNNQHFSHQPEDRVSSFFKKSYRIGASLM